MGTGQRAQGEMTDAIADWLEEGNEASRPQIQEIFGINKAYASIIMARLKHAGIVHVIDRRKIGTRVVDIFAYKQPEKQTVDISACIANQPDLVRAWNGALVAA